MTDLNTQAMVRQRKALERTRALVNQGMWPACGESDDGGLIERWGLPLDKAPLARVQRPRGVAARGAQVDVVNEYIWVPFWAVLAVNPDLDLQDNPFSHVFHSLTENKPMMLALKTRLDSHQRDLRNRFILLSEFRMQHEDKLKADPLLHTSWTASFEKTAFELDRQK